MPLPSFQITCTKNELIARDVYEVWFQKPADFHFKAGQYIMIDVPLIENENDIQVRAYSMASTDSNDNLVFAIKLISGGRMSRWIVERLKVGTTMRMQGPLGIFTLSDTSSRDVVMICTGTGNAPFISMLEKAIEMGDKRKFDIIYGVRCYEDLFWEEKLKTLEKQNKNIRVHMTLSQPSADWKGLQGYVQDIIPGLNLNLMEKEIYVCGSPIMTSVVKKLFLEEWGVPKAQLHVEGYI